MKPHTDLRHDGTLPDGTQTDEQLRRFRAAMDMSGDAIYLVDRATMRFVDVNQTACTRTGYTREELLGMGPQDLLKTGREDLERGYDEVIAAGEQGITTESTARYKDGRKSQAELHRRALRTGDGWIIVSIARDITERKRAERASRQIGRMYAALSATNEAILRARLPEELYQQVCDAAVFGGKLISTSVLVPGRDGPSVEIVAIAGRGEEQLRGAHLSVDESIAEGRSLVGIAFRTLQPCVSNDYLNDERTRLWHETARAAGVMAGAAVPLVRGGRAVGVLLFYSDEKGAFDEEVVKLLQRMAENIAFALDNFEREAERKRAEKALRESEEKYRIILESIEEAYYEVDLSSTCPGTDTEFIESRRFAASATREAVCSRRSEELDRQLTRLGETDPHRGVLPRAGRSPTKPVGRRTRQRSMRACRSATSSLRAWGRTARSAICPSPASPRSTRQATSRAIAASAPTSPSASRPNNASSTSPRTTN